MTKDTGNPAKADDTQDEDKNAIRKESIAGVNTVTVTAHCERQTDEKVIDHDSNELNSSFHETLNHDKEKKELLVNINKTQNRKTISSYLCIN